MIETLIKPGALKLACKGICGIVDPVQVNRNCRFDEVMDGVPLQLIFAVS